MAAASSGLDLFSRAQVLRQSGAHL
jgi:hypothetical protein